MTLHRPYGLSATNPPATWHTAASANTVWLADPREALDWNPPSAIPRSTKCTAQRRIAEMLQTASKTPQAPPILLHNRFPADWANEEDLASVKSRDQEMEVMDQPQTSLGEAAPPEEDAFKNWHPALLSKAQCQDLPPRGVEGGASLQTPPRHPGPA